jgi:hypothetical protein
MKNPLALLFFFAVSFAHAQQAVTAVTVSNVPGAGQYKLITPTLAQFYAANPAQGPGFGSVTSFVDNSGLFNVATPTSIPTLTLVHSINSASGLVQLTGSGYFPSLNGSLITNIPFSSLTGTPAFGALSILSTINNSNWSGTPLAVANGGTGTTTPAIVAGTNVTVSGSFPNQTVNAMSTSVPVRQTTLFGPVDSNGLPSFLPSTNSALSITSQNVSSSFPLVADSANGYGASGAVDSIGVSTSNVSWTGLTANSTNYLYITITSGVLNPGVTVLAPIYEPGGTPATTSGQFTFLTNSMNGYLGNGSTAPQANVVFLGEAVTGSSTVTSTVAYAYQGQYDGPWTNTLPSAGATVSANHNLGIYPRVANFVMQCITTDTNYAIGNQVMNPDGYTNTVTIPLRTILTSKTAALTTGSSVAFIIANPGSGGGAEFLPTAANWKYKFMCLRGW